MGLKATQQGLRASQGERTFGLTDVLTHIRTEFLPIMQDLCPLSGPLPKKQVHIRDP